MSSSLDASSQEAFNKTGQHCRTVGTTERDTGILLNNRAYASHLLRPCHAFISTYLAGLQKSNKAGFPS